MLSLGLHEDEYLLGNVLFDVGTQLRDLLQYQMAFQLLLGLLPEHFSLQTQEFLDFLISLLPDCRIDVLQRIFMDGFSLRLHQLIERLVLKVAFLVDVLHEFNQI